MSELYYEIKDIFQKYSGVLYGISNIVFSEYNTDYKCALVFAVPYSEILKIEDYKEERFEELIKEARSCADKITDEVVTLLKRQDIKHYVAPAAQSSEEKLVAPFSYKFAGVNAGLGWIGKNDVLITEQYGPRIRLTAILLDYDLPLGISVKKSRCPAKCTMCVDACPHNAITGKLWDIHKKRDELIDYNLCNQKRSLYIKKLGRKHACGLCMVSCPYGFL